MRPAVALLFCTIALFSLCGTCAASDIPKSSLEKVGYVFGEIRDRLWEANDYYWHRGDFERCIALLRLITELDPHDTEAFANASWLMWNAGRECEAEAFLKLGIEQNRTVDDLYFELGFFYYRAERFADAVEPLRTAVKLDPHVRTWHLLAHALERSGNTQEALQIWREREKLEPDSPVPNIQIQRILRGGPSADPAPPVP